MEVEVYLEGTDKPITFCKENYNGRNAIDYYLKDIDLVSQADYTRPY